MLIFNRNKLFLFGIYLFFVSSSFLYMRIIPLIMIRFLQILSISLFISAFRFDRKINYPRLYNFLIGITLLWGIYIIIRGNFSDAVSIGRNIYSPEGIVEYIAPLFLLFPFYRYFETIKTLLCLLLCIYIIFIISNIFVIIQHNSYLSIHILSGLSLFLGGGLAFLIIFFDNLTTKQKALVFIASFLMMSLSILLARRGLLLNTLLAYYFYLVVSIRKHRFIKWLFLLIIGGFFYIFAITYLPSNSFIYPIVNKGLTDTRTKVENLLWEDMRQEPATLIYGKGMNGKYYAEHIDEGNNYRYSIETGYLHLLLKGGFIYVILFFLMLLFPIIKGLFYNRSKLSKCAVLYLLHFIICCLLIENRVVFHPPFILMWASTSFIYSENKFYDRGL